MSHLCLSSVEYSLTNSLDAGACMAILLYDHLITFDLEVGYKSLSFNMNINQNIRIIGGTYMDVSNSHSNIPIRSTIIGLTYQSFVI